MRPLAFTPTCSSTRNVHTAARRRPLRCDRHASRSDRHLPAVDHHRQVLGRYRHLATLMPQPVERGRDVIRGSWPPRGQSNLGPDLLEVGPTDLAQVHRRAGHRHGHKRLRRIDSPRASGRHKAHCENHTSLRQNPHVITPHTEQSASMGNLHSVFWLRHCPCVRLKSTHPVV